MRTFYLFPELLAQKYDAVFKPGGLEQAQVLPVFEDAHSLAALLLGPGQMSGNGTLSPGLNIGLTHARTSRIGLPQHRSTPGGSLRPVGARPNGIMMLDSLRSEWISSPC